MKNGALWVILWVSTLASCDKAEPGVDAGQVERCCVRGSTKTVRFECEAGETALARSACSTQPDAGAAMTTVVTCGDGKVDSTDECEGSSGCSTGTCINCACVGPCSPAPNPNPQLLCSANADCPEGNGQCYNCRCAQNAIALLRDPEGDAPFTDDFQRLTLTYQSSSETVEFQVYPTRGERICIVEFRGNTLVAQVCYMTAGMTTAELTDAAGSRPLIPITEFGADLAIGAFGVKRTVMPLKAGDSIFIYNAASSAPKVIGDRVPDKGGISVDRLLGTN